mmetsp:Transcript_44504/g.121294  ORF Transcript_44504/g.121294 Transcript_44504/m.121294 type:complete len:248 (-) Transcript_44504:187-930(-)
MMSTTLNSTERPPCLATNTPPLCSGRYFPSKYGRMNFSLRSPLKSSSVSSNGRIFTDDAYLAFGSGRTCTTSPRRTRMSPRATRCKRIWSSDTELSRYATQMVSLRFFPLRITVSPWKMSSSSILPAERYTADGSSSVRASSTSTMLGVTFSLMMVSATSSFFRASAFFFNSRRRRRRRAVAAETVEPPLTQLACDVKPEGADPASVTAASTAAAAATMAVALQATMVVAEALPGSTKPCCNFVQPQ